MLSRVARPAVRAAVAAPRAVGAGPNTVATYATLREIEDRLKSIKNIEKITNTMKIVASTKLTRAQRAMNESRTFGETSNKVYESAETKPIEAEQKKKLVIVCSSDKGLCGGIHSSMSRKIRKMNADGEVFDLVIIGEKCKAQLSRTNPKAIQLSFAGIGKDVPTFADAQAIADQVVLLPEQYTETVILFNKFINATSYEPTFIEAFSEEAILESPNISAFEVEEESIGNLREYALANSLFWALAEGHACEQSARRNAMDNASIHRPHLAEPEPSPSHTMPCPVCKDGCKCPPGGCSCGAECTCCKAGPCEKCKDKCECGANCDCKGNCGCCGGK